VQTAVNGGSEPLTFVLGAARSRDRSDELPKVSPRWIVPDRFERTRSLRR
jgi:hypothetical protein